MPQRRSGIQELRLTHKRRLHNLDIKTELRKTVKSFTTAIEAKKTQEAKSLLTAVYKKIDKAAKVGLLKKNTASRRKSYYSRLLTKKA
ncbi:MAG TPA: 30S ribosomal protein S20 [Candidatus Omnitrophota bacterium]|nr:30S ribosomal protein S20 [Candidatus Omnitrophota bacterium]HQL41767.1 30S ribosomal protein S20 [Candidatus Omnitrophota bacterium]